MTIVEFLEARFDEDEAVARAFVNQSGEAPEWECDEFDGRVHTRGRLVIQVERRHAAHIARHNPARVLREVEAKRFVLALAAAIEQEVKNLGGTPAAPLANGRASAVETVLRRLATVYSDHPDYREEWRL